MVPTFYTHTPYLWHIWVKKNYLSSRCMKSERIQKKMTVTIKSNVVSHKRATVLFFVENLLKIITLCPSGASILCLVSNQRLNISFNKKCHVIKKEPQFEWQVLISPWKSNVCWSDILLRYTPRSRLFRQLDKDEMNVVTLFVLF